jgi:hypothetical protein
MSSTNNINLLYFFIGIGLVNYNLISPDKQLNQNQNPVHFFCSN